MKMIIAIIEQGILFFQSYRIIGTWCVLNGLRITTWTQTPIIPQAIANKKDKLYLRIKEPKNEKSEC